MTDPRSESNQPESNRPDSNQADQGAEQLTRMLIDLADDPDAPASMVTARTVLEAARAAAGNSVEQLGTGPSTTAGTAAQVEAAPDTAGDLRVLADRAQAAKTKAARRRTALFSLAAAAAVAAVAAVVIPLAISGNSTTTSANSANDAPAAALAQSAAAPSGPDAQAESQAAAADAAGAAPGSGTGAEAGAAPELGTTGDAEGSTGDRALESPVPPGAVNPEPTDTASESCWPALPPAATVALTATLPAGTFQAPVPLAAACDPEPVAGAAVIGTAPGTALEVRVSKADSGRCANGDGAAGVRCVPRGDGVYLATDDGGSVTAYVYGGGDEVAVGAPPDTGSAPGASGLTTDQTVAAAQAVLAALG